MAKGYGFNAILTIPEDSKGRRKAQQKKWCSKL
jgi:hypothetical protein